MAAAVRMFVGAGGGIVGVCAGAFNVVWLGLVEADISRAVGAGPHSLEVVDEKHPIVRPVLERAKGRKDAAGSPSRSSRQRPDPVPETPRACC